MLHIRRLRILEYLSFLLIILSTLPTPNLAWPRRLSLDRNAATTVPRPASRVEPLEAFGLPSSRSKSGPPPNPTADVERWNEEIRDESALLSRGRSCFSQSLPSGASSCQSIAGSSPHSNELRVKTAIKMALCEIRTSRSTRGPKECQPFEAGADESNAGEEPDPIILCSAYRRWEDSETAREFHQSTATRLADFVQQLQDLELVKKEAMATESEQRARAFQDISHHITSRLEPLFAAFRTNGAAQLDSFALLRSELLHSIQSIEPLVSRSLEVTLQDVSHMLKDVTLEHRNQLEKVSQNTVARTTQELDRSLLAVHDAIETSIAALNQSSSQVVKEMVGLYAAVKAGEHVADAILPACNVFHCRFQWTVHSAYGENAAEQLSSSLSTSLELASRSQELQASNLEGLQRDVSVLSEAVTNLTLRTRPKLLSKNLGWLVALANRLRFDPEDFVIATMSALLRLLGVWKTGIAVMTMACIIGIAQGDWLPTSLLMRVVGSIAGAGALVRMIGISVARIRKRRAAAFQDSQRPLASGGSPTSLPMSELALEASRFALSNPPSHLRAGIGSFTRPRRMRCIESNKAARGWPAFVPAESYGTWAASGPNWHHRRGGEFRQSELDAEPLDEACDGACV
ncbi:BZ3500_MvSof-1268-A1-R1_Chr6-3g08912 [Microbotryum saponariae]|uniref:BZ3500_MvSof-1268-A1-R1_Chr6-3g08912 protein n=1 Tax=Microbotryum saponariae TaxID=289078 RepID=A0A2X0LK96_9BASI|nr:BZ3500_MvSof-1268-A1-R1_Chr6-3g08912 [Microbotryum saponariae]SDA07514.1 BZ3501_MvSof-1269-A2-R1_Chr6-2g08616 [Microbotryum saponariae]